ncbi:MAG: diguanylate cyclase [Sneathiellaceae bacterium]
MAFLSDLTPELTLMLLLGCAASLSATGLFVLVLGGGRRGWPALLAGLVSSAGLWAALQGGAAPWGILACMPGLDAACGAAEVGGPDATADAGAALAAGLPGLLARLAVLLAPALLALAAMEAAFAAQAQRPVRAGLGGLALVLAILAVLAATGSLLAVSQLPPAAALAGLLAALAALALLRAAPAPALVLFLAGALPALAALRRDVLGLSPAGEAGGLLLPAALLLSFWLLLLGLLLIRRLDLQGLEQQVWERAEAEVGEEADRRVAQALAEEVNERGRLEDRLIRATTVDAVSGLSTRAHFLSSARALYRQRQEARAVPCAIAVISVDELREINAYYGFKGGDATLAAIGRAIAETEQGEVPPCRWSGSRFCIWLAPKRGQSAVLLAERLRGTLGSTQVPLPEGRFQITVSVGVAEDHDGQGLDRVVTAAEAALREAEAAGGNRVASA